MAKKHKKPACRKHAYGPGVQSTYYRADGTPVVLIAVVCKRCGKRSYINAKTGRFQQRPGA